MTCDEKCKKRREALERVENVVGNRRERIAFGCGFIFCFGFIMLLLLLTAIVVYFAHN